MRLSRRFRKLARAQQERRNKRLFGSRNVQAIDPLMQIMELSRDIGLSETFDAFDLIPEFSEPLNNADIKYLLFYGGRGGAKSISVFRWAVQESFKANYQNAVILVARETTASLRNSVIKMIKDIITDAGAGKWFKNDEFRITNLKTNCTFVFQGLMSNDGGNSDRVSERIKGLAGCKLVILEEAAGLTAQVIEKLLPSVTRDTRPRDGMKYGFIDQIRELLERSQGSQKGGARIIAMMNPILGACVGGDPIADQFQRLHRAALAEGRPSPVSMVRINITDLPPHMQDASLLAEMRADRHLKIYGWKWLGEASPALGNMLLRDAAKTDETKSEDAIWTEIANCYDGEIYCSIDPAIRGSEKSDYSAATFLCKVQRPDRERPTILIWGFAEQANYKDLIKPVIDECETIHKKTGIAPVIAPECNIAPDLPRELMDVYDGVIDPLRATGNKEQKIVATVGQYCEDIEIIELWSDPAYIDNLRSYQAKKSLHDDPIDSLANGLIASGIYTEYRQPESWRYGGSRFINGFNH